MESRPDRKLIEVINEIDFRGKAGRKMKAEGAESCRQFFVNYYGGKSRDEEPRKQSPVLDLAVSGIREDQEDFAEGIVDGVRSYPNDKFVLTGRLEVLLRYLNTWYGFSLSEKLLDNFKCRDRNDRLLKILKYLHEGEKSRAQIASDFGISERVLADDMQTLQDGFEFMDVRMSISELARKKNTYRSIIHPVFLALNNSEIYSATVGLKLLSRGTVFEEPLNRIADALYDQLSDQARGMVDPHTDNRDFTIGNGESRFLNTADMMRLKRPFAYFLKEPLPCQVRFRENGETMEITGTLHLPDNDPECRRIIVSYEGGSRAIDIDAVESIIRIYPRE